MRFLADLTLRKKITLLTALGLLFGIGVFSFLGMRAVNQATETMLQDRLTTARLVADYLDEKLGHALNELKDTVQMIESDGARDNIELQIETLEDTYSRLSIYTNSIYLVNEQGQIIWSRPETPRVIGINISSYANISQVIRTGEASISGLVLAPVTDAPVIFLTSPIGEGQGNESVLVMAIDLAQSSISGLVQPVRLGETGYVEIIDQNGVVVARTEPGPKLVPFEKSDHSGRFAALIAAGEPTRGLCHTCHEPMQKVERKDVLAFVPLSKANWGVIIRQSEEEALAPIYDLRQNLILFGVVLAIVAFLFVLITTRDVVNRIRMLTVASRRMADGDLVSHITVSQKDEVGILARALEDMRIKLRTSYEELEQLHQEVQRKDEMRGELLQDLFSIQEEERRRLSRELHDETSQVVASINASLEAVAGMLPPSANKAKTILRKAQDLSINILDEIHKLIYELRPTLLDDLGLVAAIRWLVDNNLEPAGVVVNFKTSGRVRRLDTRLETTLFRVIQEAFYNIARHADATSVEVRLHFKKSIIRVCIRDDGKGFDVAEAISAKDRPRGLGLLGMKERVELVNGTFSIQSSPAGGGTEINIEIPLEQEVANG